MVKHFLSVIRIQRLRSRGDATNGAQAEAAEIQLDGVTLGEAHFGSVLSDCEPSA
jgi:hypothetical protein